MKYQKLKRNLYTACVVANLFLIPSPVLWAEQSYAQSTRLSLELSNATISDVFASVEKNSEYRFFYSDAVRAELYRNVDVNIKNKTIDRILSEVLDGTNLTYFLNDRQVMIIRKEEKTQQEKKISINGTVRDAQQEPLPGVNVLVKGTTIGTTTDIDGNYFISVPDKNAVLVFSYIGFESQEVKVGGQININVNMSEESNSLDEVVVVGYGSQKRASVVGSITAIEPAQLQQGTTRAVSNNLAGQLAGVIAVQRNGEPGSDGSDFWIRGISSFKWYAGFKNYDGKFRFSQTYDPAKWKRAADANRELIEAAHAAGHDLVREYNADGSIDPFMSCYNVFFLRGDQNPEALFIRSDCNFSEFEKHATPRGASGNGGLGVYQTLVDAFAMKDGSLPITGYDGNYGKPIINKESGYTERGFSAQKDIRKTKYNLYRNCPGATVDSVGADGCTYNQVAASGTYNMYVGREPRFYLTVMWNRQWYHQAEREVQMMSNEQDGGPTHDAPQNGYLNRKKVSLDQNQRNGIHPYRPGILYRLGEAYLNYAEALNECDPGNPDILKYLNLIRERAGMPQYGTGKDSNGFDKIPLNGQDEVREAIYHERRVELCCENGLRYLDLRRWKKAEEVLNQPMYGMNFSGTKLSDDPNDDAAFFKRTQYIKRVYERKFYWYPIYQDQIDKDPTLVQAPFWDK